MAKRKAAKKGVRKKASVKNIVEKGPTKSTGRVYSIIGLISAIISIGLIPPLFGLIAVILGIVARFKGDKKLGLWVIILGIVFAIIGMILGATLVN